jgi:uncharacterized protein (TIGR00369 family)
MDSSHLAAALSAAVPFSSTLGIVFDEVSPQRAVARMPDDARLHNHVGGPHAGALFALGETASGGIVIAAFGEHMGQVTPLAAGAEIRYRRVAKGEVTATATLDDDPQALLAALSAEGKVQFQVAVSITDGAGETTAEMTVRWHLRANR